VVLLYSVEEYFACLVAWIPNEVGYENMPYARLAGPALVNYALQQVNDLIGSFWPGQSVLHGKDILQLQS
jgi:hypothetical protein